MAEQDGEIPNQPMVVQQPPVLDYRTPTDDADRHFAMDVIGFAIGTVGIVLFVGTGIVTLITVIQARMWGGCIVGALFILVGIAPARELLRQLRRWAHRVSRQALLDSSLDDEPEGGQLNNGLPGEEAENRKQLPVAQRAPVLDYCAPSDESPAFAMLGAIFALFGAMALMGIGAILLLFSIWERRWIWAAGGLVCLASGLAVGGALVKRFPGSGRK